MYPTSGSSSLEAVWNPSHPSFFGEVLFDDLSINPLSRPNTMSSMSVSESTNLSSITSNPCSPNLQGLGGWTGDGNYDNVQYSYEEDADDEDDGRNYANSEFENDNRTEYTYQQHYSNAGNNGSWS
jgi:hypothetical protein